MDPRNTCISSLRLEVASGHICIFVEMSGRWYKIMDEDMLTRSLTLTALQIDRAVSAVDEVQYLAHVGAQPARDGV